MINAMKSSLNTGSRKQNVTFAYIVLHPTYIQKVSEYDQEIPQSHTKDQPTAPCRRATQQYINDNNKTTTLEQTVAQATGGGGGRDLNAFYWRQIFALDSVVWF